MRASTGDACWRNGLRRLRVRPRPPNLRGPRETPPGPTTWVRPATDWWGRMNAGESPRNQGRSVKAAPVRLQKAVSRSKEKRRSGAPRGAPVRVMDRQFPPAGGTARPQGGPRGAALPHQRLSALRSLIFLRDAPSSAGEGNQRRRTSRLDHQGRRSFGLLRAGCLKRESETVSPRHTRCGNSGSLGTRPAGV